MTIEPGRAAPAGGLDPLLAGEPDEVRDDQEVAGVAHREDDAELVVEPRLELRRDRPVAPLEAALALLAEPALDGLAVRAPGSAGSGACPSGSLRSVISAIRRVLRIASGWSGKSAAIWAADFSQKSCVSNFIRLGRVDVVARPDAEQDVVGVGLGLVDVVEVVRDDERQAGLRGEPQELLVERAAAPAGRGPGARGRSCPCRGCRRTGRPRSGRAPSPRPRAPGDLAAEAGREPDEAFAVRARCSRSIRGL